MKRVLGWLWWIPILLAAAVVGEIPWIKHAGAVLDAHRDVGIGVTVVAAVLGLAIMLGSLIASMMATDAEALSHAEVEASLKRQRDAAALPYVFRRSRYWVRGAAAGRGTDAETTLPAMKAAWRSGDWRRDPHWRRIFTTALGAALLTVGLFGIFVVVAPMPVKVLCAGAILYPAVRLAMALRQS